MVKLTAHLLIAVEVDFLILDVLKHQEEGALRSGCHLEVVVRTDGWLPAEKALSAEIDFPQAVGGAAAHQDGLETVPQTVDHLLVEAGHWSLLVVAGA